MKDRSVINNPEYAGDLLVWCNFVGLYKSSPFHKRILESQKTKRKKQKPTLLFEEKKNVYD